MSHDYFSKRFFFDLSVLFYGYEYFACMFMCTLCVFLACMRPEEGMRIPATGVPGSGSSMEVLEIESGLSVKASSAVHSQDRIIFKSGHLRQNIQCF